MNDSPVYRTALVVTDPCAGTYDPYTEREVHKMVFEPGTSREEQLFEFEEVIDQYKTQLMKAPSVFVIHEENTEFAWNRRLVTYDKHARIRNIRDFRIMDYIDLEEV